MYTPHAYLHMSLFTYLYIYISAVSPSNPGVFFFFEFGATHFRDISKPFHQATLSTEVLRCSCVIRRRWVHADECF